MNSFMITQRHYIVNLRQISTIGHRARMPVLWRTASANSAGAHISGKKNASIRITRLEGLVVLVVHIRPIARAQGLIVVCVRAEAIQKISFPYFLPCIVHCIHPQSL